MRSWPPKTPDARNSVTYRETPHSGDTTGIIKDGFVAARIRALQTLHDQAPSPGHSHAPMTWFTPCPSEWHPYHQPSQSSPVPTLRCKQFDTSMAGKPEIEKVEQTLHSVLQRNSDQPQFSCQPSPANAAGRLRTGNTWYLSRPLTPTKHASARNEISDQHKHPRIPPKLHSVFFEHFKTPFPSGRERTTFTSGLEWDTLGKDTVPRELPTAMTSFCARSKKFPFNASKSQSPSIETRGENSDLRESSTPTPSGTQILVPRAVPAKLANSAKHCSLLRQDKLQNGEDRPEYDTRPRRSIADRLCSLVERDQRVIDTSSSTNGGGTNASSSPVQSESEHNSHATSMTAARSLGHLHLESFPSGSEPPKHSGSRVNILDVGIDSWQARRLRIFAPRKIGHQTASGGSDLESDVEKGTLDSGLSRSVSYSSVINRKNRKGGTWSLHRRKHLKRNEIQHIELQKLSSDEAPNQRNYGYKDEAVQLSYASSHGQSSLSCAAVVPSNERQQPHYSPISTIPVSRRSSTISKHSARLRSRSTSWIQGYRRWKPIFRDILTETVKNKKGSRIRGHTDLGHALQLNESSQDVSKLRAHNGSPDNTKKPQPGAPEMIVSNPKGKEESLDTAISESKDPSCSLYSLQLVAFPQTVHRAHLLKPKHNTAAESLHSSDSQDDIQANPSVTIDQHDLRSQINHLEQARCSTEAAMPPVVDPDPSTPTMDEIQAQNITLSDAELSRRHPKGRMSFTQFLACSETRHNMPKLDYLDPAQTSFAKHSRRT